MSPIICFAQLFFKTDNELLYGLKHFVSTSKWKLAFMTHGVNQQNHPYEYSLSLICFYSFIFLKQNVKRATYQTGHTSMERRLAANVRVIHVFMSRHLTRVWGTWHVKGSTTNTSRLIRHYGDKKHSWKTYVFSIQSVLREHHKLRSHHWQM